MTGGKGSPCRVKKRRRRRFLVTPAAAWTKGIGERWGACGVRGRKEREGKKGAAALPFYIGTAGVGDGVTPQNFKFWNVTKIH
jgi:hypothetical protein